MKHTFVLFIILLGTIGCSGPAAKPGISSASGKLKVGVFNGHGGAQTCIWETVAALRIDPEMEARMITSADLAGGVLDSLDAIVIPGGGGSRQFLNLGEDNRRRIEEFVSGGKGAVGICAGAYLFSNTPGYACMRLNGEKAIDIAHDNRGHGLVKFTLSASGQYVFPELAAFDTCYVMYYEGPVFVKNPSDTLQNTVLALMQSDVKEEGGAPAGMTDGKPFFISNSYGKGRVFSSIAHPEATPGMMWMIPRMVRWTLDKPLIPYKKEVVRPDFCRRELLMSPDRLQREAALFKVLLYGSDDEKIAALDWLEAHYSWDAKRWVQGLLYDASPAVRLRAAEYIADMDGIIFLRDLQAAYAVEQETPVRAGLKKQLDRVEALLP